ncbi:MAG: VWA domain-containing protein [Hyphomicrobiaceae bacterium]
MTIALALPRAARPFVTFASLLRANGFAVATEQTQSFLAAVDLLGPGSMRDIYRAAVATLGPQPDRRELFDALYRRHFLGHSLPDLAEADASDDDMKVLDEQDGRMEPPEADDEDDAGAEATGTERLTLRRFGEAGDLVALRRLRRRAPEDLPRRRSRRFRSSRHGKRPDMRRTLRQAARRDGEVVELPALRRRSRQRRILLLIDVSGSMKAETESAMRFAHALARSAERLEVFTLGTRLTRVTRALRMRNAEQALAIAGTLVADWDGGTRLGDALQAFLGVPRFAGFARGALVIVVSDGLERGNPSVMTDSVERMSRLAWSILWLTPLASRTPFVPVTEALKSVAPFVDHFGRGGSISALTDEVLSFARQAA